LISLYNLIIYNISKEVNFGSKPEEEKVILGFGKGYYDK
jgi:hypothetical protein